MTLSNLLCEKENTGKVKAEDMHQKKQLAPTVSLLSSDRENKKQELIKFYREREKKKGGCGG